MNLTFTVVRFGCFFVSKIPIVNFAYIDEFRETFRFNIPTNGVLSCWFSSPVENCWSMDFGYLTCTWFVSLVWFYWVLQVVCLKWLVHFLFLGVEAHCDFFLNFFLACAQDFLQLLKKCHRSCMLQTHCFRNSARCFFLVSKFVVGDVFKWTGSCG